VRVALLSDVFASNMGYLENLLPKYLARQGAEVHLITMDLPPYYWMKEFKQTYGQFIESQPAGTVAEQQGYSLHVLGHRRVAGYMRMVGLGGKLRALRPDVVQTTSVIGWAALDAAFYRAALGYELFTGSHMTASVFPLATKNAPWWNRERLRCFLLRTLPGRFVSRFAHKCYAVTEDCAHIASRYFGVPCEDVEVMYLGVDTEYFHPAGSLAESRERGWLRRRLGFEEQDIVCIYTGKLLPEKQVGVLARAVGELRRRGLRFRALVVGDGPERALLAQDPSCVLLGFMPFHQLGAYYRAADVAVWPGNESTSMLDAAACGLPVVISDRVEYRAPVEGNGRVFHSGSVEHLSHILEELRDPASRKRLGLNGAARMAREFSWEAVAARRLRDYRAALPARPAVRETRESVIS